MAELSSKSLSAAVSDLRASVTAQESTNAQLSSDLSGLEARFVSSRQDV